MVVLVKLPAPLRDRRGRTDRGKGSLPRGPLMNPTPATSWVSRRVLRSSAAVSVPTLGGEDRVQVPHLSPSRTGRPMLSLTARSFLTN